MSATQLSIANEDQAWIYIKSALEGSYDDEVVELNFDSWPAIRLKVVGDRYDSTITTSMMRALVELQVHLHRVYSEVVYGKNARSLTSDERNALEIVFKVEQGSSDIIGDLGGFFSELGKNAMEKMTGAQVVTVVLGAAALFATVSAYNKSIDAKQAAQESRDRQEILVKLIEVQPKLQGILNEQSAAYLNILKSVNDADQVTLDGVELTNADIAEITKQEKVSTEVQRIDGLYMITSFKIREDSYKLEVMSHSDGAILSVDLQKGQLGLDDMDQVFKAFTSEKPIDLKVAAKVRNGVVSSANILGIKAIKQDAPTTLSQGPSREY